MSLEQVDNNLNSNKYDAKKSVIGQTRDVNRDMNHDWKYLKRDKGLSKEEYKQNTRPKSKTNWGFIAFIISSLLLLLAIVFGAYTLYYKSNQLDESKINMMIDSPDSVDPGAPFDIKITTSNGNKISINNVHVNLEYNKSLSASGIKNIEKKEFYYDTVTYGGAKMENISNNLLYGKNGDIVSVKVKITYSVDGNSAQFYKSINKDIKLLPRQISIKIDGPQDIDTGEAFTYKVTVKNDSDQDIQKAQVSFSFPAEYNTLQASAPLNPKNEWIIGKIAKGTEFVDTIVATQMGISGEKKAIRIKLEDVIDNVPAVINNYNYEYSLIYQPLNVSAKLKVDHNDSSYIYKGQEGILNILWENTLNEAITDLHFVIIYNSTSTNLTKDYYPQLADIAAGSNGFISVPLRGDGDKNGDMRIGIVAYGNRLQSSITNDKIGNADILVKVRESISH